MANHELLLLLEVIMALALLVGWPWYDTASNYRVVETANKPVRVLSAQPRLSWTNHCSTERQWMMEATHKSNIRSVHQWTMHSPRLRGVCVVLELFIFLFIILTLFHTPLSQERIDCCHFLFTGLRTAACVVSVQPLSSLDVTKVSQKTNVKIVQL
jgi:hypothetical protein